MATPNRPQTEDAGPRPTFRRIRAVVNPLSGSVQAGAADILRRRLSDRGLEAEVVEAGPHEIEDALKAAVGAGPDLVILLAGDGTARLAADLCGQDGPLLAPLPGGTMNMLPHALYGAVSWEEALGHALDVGVERPISGGEVGGRRFYVAAILGTPTLFAPAREAMREGKLRLALLRTERALKRSFKGRLRFVLDDGPEEKAGALTLMCPLVSRALGRDDVLEALALDPANAAEAFRLGARTLLSDLLGDWREDPAVKCMTVRSGRVWMRGHVPAVLDGEPHRLHGKAAVRFIPAAFRALALHRTGPEPQGAHERRSGEAGSAVTTSLSRLAEH